MKVEKFWHDGGALSLSQRLHWNLQRKCSGDFARIASAVKRKQSAATRAARHMQPLFVPHRRTRGENSFFALTFTCHFRRWRTPHWGDVARECPGGFARVGRCPFDARKRLLSPQRYVEDHHHREACHRGHGHPRRTETALALRHQLGDHDHDHCASGESQQEGQQALYIHR